MSSPSATDALPLVLFALLAVIATGLVLSRLLARIGQPPVIGEVLAGIVLGPSVLGPSLSARILPPEVAPHLGVIAQVGIVLYMFLVGIDLNTDLVTRHARAAVVTAIASIAVPLASGALLARLLYARLSGPGVPFATFALFLAVAMSITAFPVLARILTDRGIARTELGAFALSCAAANDVAAWCLLAIVAGVARASSGAAIGAVLGAAAYLGAMLVVVRPLVRRICARWESGGLPPYGVALVLAALMASAWAAERAGLHAIFGGFLLGAVVPHESAVARAFRGPGERIVTALLLPAFFATTGMHTRLGLLSGRESWLLCGAIVLVATAGKFGGTFAAARACGRSARDAAALGALMNTRGLMELIVLGVGLDLGVISPTLFTMMVVMALVTTMATSPALAWLVPGARP